MSNFKYINNNLYIEKLKISKIISQNKTPFYLYSYNQLKENYKKFSECFKDSKPLVCFAAKSNSNLTILKELGKLGCGADVVSGGELLKAIKAGIKTKKIVFSGVGKTEEELRLAINKKILLINIESESEAKLINKIAKKSNKKVSIGFRINPNVDAKSHKKISTGKAENKFGLSIKNFNIFLKKIKKYKNIKFEALSVHIGSQILSETPYKKTLSILTNLIKNLNINLKYVDLGGGFGINYSKRNKKINLKNYARLVHSFKKNIKCNIIFEPGRSIVGNIGMLISKVQYIKKGKNKNFIILDAGMNDFMRPALYNAEHEILPINKNNKKSNREIEFVGPICESTCKFMKYKQYQVLKENEFIAISDTGAYGSSLSSNYNTKPLIAEILVNKKKIKVIKKKQNLLKLINS
tara:strand:- start:2778 stop:4007 length:1230 start_codon:yes stop_codon:yes gene_type:complete